MRIDRAFVQSLSELSRVRHMISKGEMDVWRAAASGKMVKEIAAARGTSLKTVQNQIECLYDKLGINSRAELTIAAIRYRVIEVEVLPEDPS